MTVRDTRTPPADLWPNAAARWLDGRDRRHPPAEMETAAPEQTPPRQVWPRVFPSL